MAVEKIDDYAEFEIFVIGDDEEWIAGTSGPRVRAQAEAMSYADRYASEGDTVRIYEVSRHLFLELNGTE